MNKFTFLAALIIFLCSFSGGDYSEQEPIKAEIELIENYGKLEEESIHGRPRMPLNVIYANYSEGYFSIELESGNQASVEIKTMNDEFIIAALIESNETVFIGELSDFIIECTLSNGETYYGEYHVNNQ